MQPYLDSYKLAGIVGIIADKSGEVHYQNLLGYSNVEAKKPIRADDVFWIASMTTMFGGASSACAQRGDRSAPGAGRRRCANFLDREKNDSKNVLKHSRHSSSI